MAVIKRDRFYHLDSYNSYRFINYRFVLEEFVRNCTKNSDLLLDAGCGGGASILWPPEKGEIVGIDVLRANVMASKRYWRKRSFVVADLTTLPFIEGAFGGTVSADVLEHIEDKVAAINELARVTKRGGFFVGCSSNILNPVLWLDAKFPMLTKPLVTKFALPGHYERHSRFSPLSLTKTLNVTGYRMDCLYLLGFPQFLETRTPLGLSQIWVLFDRLTNKKILGYLKEILLWKATRV